MKSILKTAAAIILLLAAISCASVQPRPRAMPEKYNLDNELEAVDQITTFRVPRWQDVDRQSIILRVNWRDYYLLVLRRPIFTMNPWVISLTGGPPRLFSAHRFDFWAQPEYRFQGGLIRIVSGHDMVIVQDSGIEEYIYIDRIYKLDGKKHKEEIRKRLRGE